MSGKRVKRLYKLHDPRGPQRLFIWPDGSLHREPKGEFRRLKKSLKSR